MIPTLPTKAYLPRKVVAQAVGGRRLLERLEREGKLTRCYPCGLRHARYRYAEVKRLLDELMGAVC
jgi:hypothetical protein